MIGNYTISSFRWKSTTSSGRNTAYTSLHLEILERRDVPAPLTPVQVRHAYGFDQITFSGGTVLGDGAGQTIAIVDAYDDPNIASDLAAFDSYFGLPAPPSFVKATPQGLPAANAGWSSEIALDVEWAHAIAPKANILLVEAKSSSYADLLGAVDYAAKQPGVSVVSMSWGSGEFRGETNYDSHFRTPSGHSGVTFVASSGDNGAPPSWPAISPNVLGVGGTSLNVGTDGTYLSESGWSGSGGGKSTYESKPTYQTYVTTNSTKRSSPDVAYNADPSTGVYVYDTMNGGTGWWQVGGTSAGAPQWAALVAIANEGRALTGTTTADRAPLDGPSQTLYAIYKEAQSSYATYYHDVTTGNNGFAAGAKYDFVTGLGSPVANRVVAALTGWKGSGSTGSLSAASTGTGTAAPAGLVSALISSAFTIEAPDSPANLSPKSNLNNAGAGTTDAGSSTFATDHYTSPGFAPLSSFNSSLASQYSYTETPAVTAVSNSNVNRPSGELLIFTGQRKAESGFDRWDDLDTSFESDLAADPLEDAMDALFAGLMATEFGSLDFSEKNEPNTVAETAAAD